MLRFPIDTMITKEPSDLLLNNQWTISYGWSEYGSNSQFLEVIIKTHLRITSAEIPVFGKLGVQALNSAESVTTEFAKVMNGRQRENLVNLYPKRSYVRPGSKLIYNFKGVVNIILNSRVNVCTNVLEKERNKKSELLVLLSNDFGRLLDPQTSCFADVNLVCGDISIPAHKSILSARSPVFAAMFKHPMKENIANGVHITDIDASVLRSMIIYMYTGKVSDLNLTSVSKLLFAADKYQLQKLKEFCCDFLKDNISLQNMLRILVLGDLLAEDLKSFAMNYISNKCENFSTIENTEEWKELRKKRPSLAMDVLTFLVKARDKK